VVQAVTLGVVLLKLVGLLVVAKLAGEIAERLRQPAVLGELLAGVLLGPTILGSFSSIAFTGASEGAEIITFVAELGALLLLFEVGLETHLGEMRKVGASSALVALLGIVGSFVAGFVVSYAMGLTGFWSDAILFHVFIGATLTATSVGITARVLKDMGRLATPEARIILGAAVLDDVGGLLILAFVTALAAGAVSVGALALTTFLALGFLVAAVAAGLWVMPRVMDSLAAMRVRGAVLAGAFAFCLLLAVGAEAVQLAAIVGAFAAGLVLASTRQREAIHERVRHVGDIFVPLFFVYVGLQVDLRGAGADAGRIAISVALLLVAALVGKLVCAWGVREKGLNRYAVAVGMLPRGEVGLIFALVGLKTLVKGAPLLASWEYVAILIVVALTTLVTPAWLKAALGRRPAVSSEDAAEP
jgi:Kef-type K+ transport system membrane component KefB